MAGMKQPVSVMRDAGHFSNRAAAQIGVVIRRIACHILVKP